MRNTHFLDWCLAFTLPSLIAASVSWFFYRRYGGLARGASWLAWLGTLFIVAWLVVPRFDSEGNEVPMGQTVPQYVWATYCAAVFAWLAGPFIVRLWGKWIGGRISETERTPGPAGWQAWLAGRHVLYAVLLAFFAWQAWDFSFILGILVFGGALAAYPIILAIGQAPSAASSPKNSPDFRGA